MADIELVIKIPEQMYLNAKSDTLCGAGILVNAIKNGIPRETVTEFADRCRECGREKVLDKIRAEIKAIAFDWQEIDGEHESFMVVDLNEALNIIDKHKTEGNEKE